MSAPSKTVVFFGNERLATAVSTSTPTLKALIAGGYHVAAVVVSQQTGQSRQQRQLEISTTAAAHQIPVITATSSKELLAQIQPFNASVGVLVAFGKLVPTDVINSFPKGIINVHPSLLPRHRGPTPIESAILDGDQQTGVSIMRLAAAMDAGPVFAQAQIALKGTETKQALADRLANRGSELLLQSLPQILAGKLEPVEQDDSLATQDHLVQKSDGQLDWQKPAARLEREIRAYAGWPKSRTDLAKQEVVVTKAHVVERSLAPGEVSTAEKQLVIGTSEQALAIDQLIPAGKTEMTAQAFLAGYKDRF